MPTLIELTAQIVSSHVSNIQMTSDEMLQELQKVHVSLKALEAGSPMASSSTEAPKLTIKQAFKKNEVICMICGKSFKTLKRHLTLAHDLKPGQYRKQFNIPSSISLTAKSYSESRRQMAIDKGLGEGLVIARMIRAAKKAPVAIEKAKAPIKTKVNATAPTKKTKTPVAEVREKVAVPAVKVKSPEAAVRKIAAVPAKVTNKK
jgi:predicted transcriptional regulator